MTQKQEDMGASPYGGRATHEQSPQAVSAVPVGIPSAISREVFCARFKARMLERAGPTFDDGSSIAEYAEETGPTYFEQDDWLTREGPEECADADMSYWGEG